jgi:hypothetical protein
VLREGMLADHLDGWHAALFDVQLDTAVGAPVDAPVDARPLAALPLTAFNTT